MCAVIPAGECRNCYHHAYCVHNIWSPSYVPSKGDCQQCIGCAASGHQGHLVPKPPNSFW